MSRIRSKNTKPELFVRNVLSKSSIKYKLYPGKLPGKPDILIPSNKLVVFINGCFWHQHKGCKRKVMPKTNVKYWREKLGRNTRKQKDNIRKLKKLGYHVVVLWECEINRSVLIKKRVESALK